MNHIYLDTAHLSHYALLDAGYGRKLERFGQIITIRDEPKAWWKPSLSEKEWQKADATFVESKEKPGWKFHKKVPQTWQIKYEDCIAELRFTENSKHVGIFPEHEPQWKAMRQILAQNQGAEVLNLFGYTGMASLVAAKAGAKVTHVDASPRTVDWLKKNQECSGLAQAPIRRLTDDAAKFVEREIRRGKKYDGILLDPPTYGRGPKGELWKIERDLLPLLENCAQILSDKALFMMLTVYCTEISSISLGNLMEDCLGKRKAEIRLGENLISQQNGRKLPLSMYAWATFADAKETLY